MKYRVSYAIAGLASVAALVVVLTPDVEGAKNLVKDAGVWVLWGIVGSFVVGVVQARAVLRRESWWNLRAASLVLLLSGVAHLHYPHQFKVLADELVLVGISRSIHEERQVAAPLALQDAAGAVKISYGYLDKRPYLFPFTVAFLHDLTGYRPANAFVLNAMLTPVFFYCLFLAGWKWSGTVWAGYIAVLMTAAIPLFAHNFTGAGFEVLNATLILVLFLWALMYSRTGAPELQLGLVATALLVAYTRYESVLYLVAVVGVVLWVELRERRYYLNPAVGALVVLAIPLGCIFRAVASQKAQFFQLADRGVQTAFSWSYIPGNLPSALEFFFADDHVQMASRWISIACLLGGLFAALEGVRILRTSPRSIRWGAPLLIGVTVLANMLLLLSYHWGQLSDPLVSRLAIPFMIASILATVWAAGRAKHARRVSLLLAGVAGFSIYASAIPVATKHSFARSYGPAREVETVQQFLREYSHPDMLVLTDRSLIWVCYGVWTEHINGAVSGRALVEKWMRSGRYGRVYAVQRFDVEPVTGEMKLQDQFRLPPEWETEEVVRRRLADLEVMVITRVIKAVPAPESQATSD